MSDITPIQILDKAANCFKQARQDLIAGASLLWKIKNEELWKLRHESFSAYLAEECDLSDSHASKLIQVWQYYAVEGGFSPSKIAGIDVERLYLASKIGEPEKSLASAQTLSRSELKENIIEEKYGVHEHMLSTERYSPCEKCRKFIRV